VKVSCLYEALLEPGWVPNLLSRAAVTVRLSCRAASRSMSGSFTVGSKRRPAFNGFGETEWKQATSFSRAKRI
jgi:hypothetical protein